MIFRNNLFFANPLETSFGFEIASEINFSAQADFGAPCSRSQPA